MYTVAHIPKDLGFETLGLELQRWVNQAVSTYCFELISKAKWGNPSMKADWVHTQAILNPATAESANLQQSLRVVANTQWRGLQIFGGTICVPYRIICASFVLFYSAFHQCVRAR